MHAHVCVMGGESVGCGRFLNPIIGAAILKYDGLCVFMTQMDIS